MYYSHGLKVESYSVEMFHISGSIVEKRHPVKCLRKNSYIFKGSNFHQINLYRKVPIIILDEVRNKSKWVLFFFDKKRV